ncbi:MAG: hypothetical protein KDB40_19095 [Acidimicrobiales bacterium]|nr:hypothetical protein [Acidimicrobiales bacterium]MCB9393146.1 RNA polymerase subunit sigma-24 [Acidimicrobiaceae bacterium]
MTSTSGRSSTSADDRAHPLDEQLASLHRQEWGRLLSVLVTRTRRLDLAEDALAEAFARAASRWPDDGVPRNPAAWLFVTAHRLVIGRLRHEAVAGRVVPLLAVGTATTRPTDDGLDADDPATGGESIGGEDERLPMLFLCCHPALSADARSALALRLVIGTPTDEIARLFLVPTPTMAARITRAKQKIVGTGIPLALPARDRLDERLDVVCRTILLAFTAGYTPGEGPDLLRIDVASDAVELARVLHRFAPDDERTRALLALVTLQHARRDARVHDGRLVTLADQDRTRWRLDEIRRGLELVATLPPSTGYAEEVRLQALLAAEHARASTAEATDWARIVAVYTELESLTGSPVVRMNRAVAVAEASGPAAGLALLDGLDDALGDGHRLHAVRGELAARAGDVPTAVRAVRAAIERCANEVERRHLAERLATWTST